MPREFAKQILAPRTYFVPARDGSGKKVPVAFTRDKIAKYVETYKAMSEADEPLKIPAPWRHDFSANGYPLLQKEPDARDNAGFWKNFEQKEDGTLWAVLESTLSDRAKELEDKAAALPADDSERTKLLETAKQLRLEEEKIGTTVQHVSPYVRNQYVDGLKREWKDLVAHVALVTKPVQPGQSNFQNVKGEEIPVIAMSEDGLDSVALEDVPKTSPNIPPNAKTNDFTDVLKALASVGLILPVDTTQDNLAERIIVAATAIDGSKENDDDDELPPGTQTSGGPTPVALSEEEIMANEKLTQVASNLAKKTYKQRIDALIEAGTFGPDYAKKHLQPLVDGYALSLDDEGAPIPQAIDTKLEALEALPATGTANVLKNVGKKTRNGIQRVALGEDVEEQQLSEPEDEDEAAAKAGYEQGAAARDAELARRGYAPAK